MAPGQTPATQGWVIDWYKSVQSTADQKYTEALQMYERQRTEWLDNNIRNRELGQPITPVPVIPKRLVWQIDGTMLKSSEVQDTSITAPVLPPPAKVTIGPPLHTDAPATTDQMLAMLTGCLQMLAELKAEVAALRAQVAVLAAK